MQIFKSSFSKIPKHARFEYEPRYSLAYTEENGAENNKRIRFVRDRIPFSNSSLITGKLKRSIVTYRKKESQKRKIRLYMFLGALVLVLLILLQNL